ncbi:DUF952 domain-containing protein [Candidatus Uabimicrobium amorphum]|uniref:Glutathione S-transferase n=1 Tax=Uabimicrobium amorphum TaxID=2596890 RepID=A0A5S9F626_UABAM|nr:DUF952 domain-containing protein [Candidatus Uabimicrobium amorphum]BBM87455.1 hypothetical protein UABAM_05864 [Candidatus Uabimicrobium amorphum]
MSEFLYHITSREEWSQAQSEYLPVNFAKEGFIHCSYHQQIVGSANKFFHGQRNLVLLKIIPQKITSNIVDENLEGGKVMFPHIYGPLPVDAVTQVIDFPCEQDGSFCLPQIG